METQKDRECRFDGSGRRQRVSDHRLIRRHRNLPSMLAHHPSHRQVFGLVVLGGTGAVSVDVINVLRSETSVSDRVFDTGGYGLAFGLARVPWNELTDSPSPRLVIRAKGRAPCAVTDLTFSEPMVRILAPATLNARASTSITDSHLAAQRKEAKRGLANLRFSLTTPKDRQKMLKSSGAGLAAWGRCRSCTSVSSRSVTSQESIEAPDKNRPPGSSTNVTYPYAYWSPHDS
jgi:hypothetical protein